MSDAKTTLEELKKKVSAPAPVAVANEPKTDEKEQNDRIDVMKEILEGLATLSANQETQINDMTDVLAALYEDNQFMKERLDAIEVKLFGGVATKVTEPAKEEKEPEKAEIEPKNKKKLSVSNIFKKKEE